MLIPIRSVGNSKAIILSKALLAQTGFEDQVEVTVHDDSLILAKPQTHSREDWAMAAKAIAEEKLGKEWVTFSNDFDKTWKW